MIRTVLIDLDDTLLYNDIDRFIPAYLKKLSTHMQATVPAERFLPALLDATRRMDENRDPTRTLHHTFAEAFYPALETTEETLRLELDAFYATQFGSLRDLTQPRPGAVDLVAGAIAAHLEVVAATGPLFPATAVRQRLEWAGVAADDFGYSLITSYDTVHFAKPWPEYYAEILGLLGRPPTEAAMIGNDVGHDMEPARLLGMAVFHVGPEPDARFPSGDLHQALSWLRDRAEHEVDDQAARQPAAIQAFLRGQLAALHGLTSALSPEEWTERQSAAAQAPVEAVCHLRDVEIEVNLPRLEILRRQQQPFISAVETDRWVKERDYIHQSGPEALAAFVRARTDLLARMQALPPDIWTRPARHSLLGPTSLAELMQVAAEHERLHLAALRPALARLSSPRE